MDVTIRFEDGPIEAEISAEDGEDFQSALDSLRDFMDEYEPLGSVESSNGTNPEDSSPQLDRKTEAESVSEEADSSSIDSDDPLVSNTGVERGTLQRILKMGSADGTDVEDFPKIIGNTDVLGDSNQEKLLHGSAVILTILSERHGISKVRTSELKDALSESGLNEDNWNNMTGMAKADVYFNRRGQGNSATTEIRDPAKEDAYDEIKKLADAHSSSESS
jgi:hypothetical protein